jgi:hypothetical protein
METASELMMINPKKFNSKSFAIFIPTNRWTNFNNGYKAKTTLNEEEHEEGEQENRAKFKIEIFSDQEIREND